MGYAYLDIEISQCYCYGTLVKIHHPVEALYKFKRELYVLLRDCHEFVWKIQHEGCARDKYSTRQSQVLYLSRDTSPSAVFFVQTNTDSSSDGILYFD